MSEFQGPLFVVGMPRSGTKLLRGLLNEHSRIGIPLNETEFLPHWLRSWTERGDLSEPAAFERFYAEVGKTTIRVNKEVPGHVANRLQAALWREALYLVREGVASVEDVDRAVWAGPGLRWGAMGPHMLFNLGAGEGGMKSFCERYADSFHRWWDDLGTMQLDAGIGEILEKGLADEANGKSVEELSEERNALITAHLKAVKDLR